MPFESRCGIVSASLLLAVNLFAPAARAEAVNTSIPNDVRQLSIDTPATASVVQSPIVRPHLTFGQFLGQGAPCQAGGNTKVLVGAYTEMDLRIGWHATKTTEISLEGFNLLHPCHLEVNDPTAYPPLYVPRAFMLNLRQSL